MSPLYSTLSADIYTVLDFSRPGKPADNVPPMDLIWEAAHWFCRCPGNRNRRNRPADSALRFLTSRSIFLRFRKHI